jgi:hypothetical protein
LATDIRGRPPECSRKKRREERGEEGGERKREEKKEEIGAMQQDPNPRLCKPI